MAYPYPITEPYSSGKLDVADGHKVHWEVVGNPDGKPAVVLHGGPGSGSIPGLSRMFNPEKYMIVQFDQRNCGQSTPNAGEPRIDLSTNTTQHLIADIEQLRTTLGVDRWLVWGGSWGTTLGLAYAQTHPGSVTELLLGSVVTTTRAEVEWVTRTMGRIFPERWQDFHDFLPPDSRDGELASAYNRLLMDPDPGVHEPAAMAWCDWEDIHVSIADGYEPFLRNQDPKVRLCFSRLVTHYWANAGFLEDGQLFRDARNLAGVPTFLAHGRRDISAPADIPVTLATSIPDAELFIAETEGHGGPTQYRWMADIADRLAE
ncbi:MAG: prolyl aminopeptidase [Acidimicrobiia bacterium]